MLLEHAIKCLISLLVSLCKDSSVCWHNTGMPSHPSDHTCDSAPSKHILYRCCDLIFVQRTQLGKEEGQEVEGWEDKLAVSVYFEYFVVAFCQKLVEKQTTMEVFSVHSFDVWAQDVFKEFFWHNRFCRLGEDLPSRLSRKVFFLISSNFLHYDCY
jgi:hypothetical protein